MVWIRLAPVSPRPVETTCNDLVPANPEFSMKEVRWSPIAVQKLMPLSKPLLVTMLPEEKGWENETFTWSTRHSPLSSRNNCNSFQSDCEPWAWSNVALFRVRLVHVLL